MLRRSNFPLYFLLAGIAGFFVFLHQPSKMDAQQTEKPGPSTELLLMGRHAIGANLIVASSSQALDSETLYDQLRNVVDNPWDRLRLAPLAAELVGVDEAKRILASLQADAEANQFLAEDRVAIQQIYQANAPPLDEDTRARLLQRHGWFAQMALTYNLGPEDEQRQAALLPARRAEQAMLFSVSGITLALFLGCALLFYYLLVEARKQRSGYAELADYLPRSSGVFLEVTVLMLALMPLFSLFGAFLPRGVAILAQLLPLLAPLWALKRGLSPGHLVGGLGWFPGRGVLAEIRAGILGYIAGLPILSLGLIASFTIARFVEGSPTHPSLELVENADASGVLMIAMLACVVAPIVEETIFRGAFYQHLRGRWQPIPAALIQAFLFAVIHPQGVIAIPILTALGFVFAAIREWRGSILASIVAHSLNNGLVILLMIMILR